MRPVNKKTDEETDGQRSPGLQVDGPQIPEEIPAAETLLISSPAWTDGLTEAQKAGVRHGEAQLGRPGLETRFVYGRVSF